MAKRVFIGIALVAFAVCALAFAQARKVTNNTKIGVVEVKRAQPGVVKGKGERVIPWHINYQGYLTDDAGTPISGTLNMVFRIWTASSGGSELWNEPQVVSVEDGLFNVVLGVSIPIPATVFELGESRWLGLEVEGQFLSPRTEITSVGYAYRAVKTDSADYALDSDKVDNFDASATPGPNDLFPLSYGDAEYVNEGQADAITSAMILNGTVGTADLADNAVNSAKILDGAIGRADVEATFKAPYADTADYALAANVGYVDSAGVSANSWRLENNTLTDLDSRWVNEGQADAVTSPMIVDGEVGTSDLGDDAVNSTKILDGTIARTDVEPTFKAPYADTADYALAANVGYVDSAGVSANSWRLENNTLTDLDSRWVNEGQVDAIDNPMIVDGTILRADVDAAFKAPYADTADYALSAPVAPDGDWTIAGNVLHPSADYGLAMRSSNVLYGTNDNTHVNFGVACTTGTSGQNYRYCTVSGGENNDASGNYATVGGGQNNTASDDAATVGGGENNTASGFDATVGGGYGNAAASNYATVSGGVNNSAFGFYATVAGGVVNIASGFYSTVGGGYGNAASGLYATVGGGWADTSAGDYSFTVGNNSVVPAAYDNSAAFNGQTATASGQTRVGTISKAAGSFTIDHPVDPTNKILNHYFVESPEMVLIYRGVAHIGGDGRAVVHLPDYFDALNRNPMVQLTGVGTAEVVYVAEEVKGNRFVIGGKPGTKVYWTVTGDRKDQSAEITRIIMPVEQAKDGDLAGRSLDDDFLATTKTQLEQMGEAGKFHFRTQAGRQKYENSRRALENR